MVQKSRQFASLAGTQILSKSQINLLVDGLFKIHVFIPEHPTLKNIAISLLWHNLSAHEKRQGHGSKLNAIGFPYVYTI